MNDILPSTDWSSDDMRPALTNILRRLDKTFSKIHKKASIRGSTDWAAASNILKGVYETLAKCPYIAHFAYLKALLTTCQVSYKNNFLSYIFVNILKINSKSNIYHNSKWIIVDNIVVEV